MANFFTGTKSVLSNIIAQRQQEAARQRELELQKQTPQWRMAEMQLRQQAEKEALMNSFAEGDATAAVKLARKYFPQAYLSLTTAREIEKQIPPDLLEELGGKPAILRMAGLPVQQTPAEAAARATAIGTAELPIYQRKQDIAVASQKEVIGKQQVFQREMKKLDRQLQRDLAGSRNALTLYAALSKNKNQKVIRISEAARKGMLEQLRKEIEGSKYWDKHVARGDFIFDILKKDPFSSNIADLVTKDEEVKKALDKLSKEDKSLFNKLSKYIYLSKHVDYDQALTQTGQNAGIDTTVPTVNDTRIKVDY